MIFCNVITEGFCYIILYVTDSTHAQGKGTIEGHENQEMRITGTILECVHHTTMWFSERLCI